MTKLMPVNIVIITDNKHINNTRLSVCSKQ